VHCHHHVRGPADLARLGRHLAGQALGLVLSGGGARGYAHIGVLRALEEAGLAVDRVGGTSIGSIYAGLIAREHGSRALEEVAEANLSDPRKLYDFTIPLVSILKGNKARRLMEKLFGDVEIADLPLDFFCISTNLSQAEPVVHRSGWAAGAILRSISVPGIAPPYEENGMLYCDGGLVDNLPVDAMAGIGPGPIISVDVSPVVAATPQARPGNPLARLLHLHHGTELDPNQPNILEILMRTVYVGANYAQRFRRHEADLQLEPPVTHYALTDWHSTKAMIEIGYQHARERLEAWVRQTANAAS
jgi:NTE family protein